MAIEVIKLILSVVGIFFIIYLIGYSTFLFLSVVIGSTALYKQKRLEELKSKLKNKYDIPISIIVPAHNEEVTVVDTVKSLLDIEYDKYEIIVVDDGSTDSTSKLLIENFNMHKVYRPIERAIKCRKEEFVYETNEYKVPITVIRKQNGGKSDALNMGINASRYPYFICIDADSMLQYDSLKNITAPMLEREDVVACGGLIRISNDTEFEKGRVKKYRLPKNILAAMQVLEYDRSFFASRIMLDGFNGNLIISGAFGLFRKDLVIAVGGYDTNTVGEDMELVMKLHVFCKLHNIKYAIKYVPDAICWSQAPENLGDLIKQRRRWHIGLFQSMGKYKELFLNMKFGMISFISYLYFLIYELLSPMIELAGIIVTVLAYFVNLININFMIVFFLLYTAFGAILSLTIFLARVYIQDTKLTFKDFLKALFLCFIEIAGLRQIMSIARMTAFIGYKDKKLQWVDITRMKQKINT